MKLSVCLIMCCVIVHAKAIDSPSRGDIPAQTALEKLLEKLETIQEELLSLRVEQDEHRKQTISNKAFYEKTFTNVQWAVQRMEDLLEKDVARNMTVLQDQSQLILEAQTTCANLRDQLCLKWLNCSTQSYQSSYKPQDETSFFNATSQIPECVTPTRTHPEQESDSTSPEMLIKLETTQPTTPTKPTTSATMTAIISTTTETPLASTTPVTTTQTTTQRTTTKITTKTPAATPKPMESIFTSCKDVESKRSGVYLINLCNDSVPVQAYCEQVEFGGGWLVVQYRFNWMVDFYRNWAEYRDGFGDMGNEFWFGMEKIHQITSARPHELIIEMKDFRGTYGYAYYDRFELGSEHEQYRLTLGKYSGTAGDCMEPSKDMKFSTKDRDNDPSSAHCAQERKFAWWHFDCKRKIVSTLSIYQYLFNNEYRGLKYSRMMIREL